MFYNELPNKGILLMVMNYVTDGVYVILLNNYILWDLTVT